MKFMTEWLSDPTIFEINRLPAHSDHEWAGQNTDFANGVNHQILSLNGTWKFHYAKNLKGRIADFEALTMDCSDWDDIQVPGHIQMQGYGTPQYVNTMYPWTGREQLSIGEVPEHDNPVGSYVKYFDVPESFAGHTLHLTFEGVENAFVVYVNGIFVGYSEDSFTPSSFDVTPYVVAGQNKIAVQVFKFSSGSWLEDQDFWRFSGIFRDVYLSCLPDAHVYDLSLTQTLNDDYDRATLAINMQFLHSFNGIVVTRLLDEEEEEVVCKSVAVDDTSLYLELVVDDVHLWSAEVPYLYHVVIELYQDDLCQEIVYENVGFREFVIENGLMWLNGKRIIFNGVNRHEFSMEKGRSVDAELIYNDLLIMKRNNINAVRTSHYPNQTCFYRYCDELGLYVIDEANLETHGTWQIPDPKIIDPDQILPGANPRFYNAVMDRARSVYERDKNHSSVLIWSCGNESFGGKTLFDMSEYFRSVDPDRPVHYEGIFHDRRYNETSDIESQMYTPAKDVAKYLDEHHDKPFILCEYAHAMGNSNGGLHKYTDLVDQYEQYQGGFIWDFVDQAILKDGKLHYGGDFAERPSDFDFCGNGIVFADRSETPKMQEVKYCYQPVSFYLEDGQVVIQNRHLFTNLDEYIIAATLECDGDIVDATILEVDCEPEEAVSGDIPFLAEIQNGNGEYTLNFHVYLDEDTVYASQGYEIAREQFVFPAKTVDKKIHRGNLRISYDGFTLGAVGRNFHVFFNQQGLVDYTYAGFHYLYGRCARPNFFRPSTQNDTANQYGHRYGAWLVASLYQQSQLVGYQTDEAHSYLEVTYHHRLFNDNETTVELVYTVFGDGEVQVDMTLVPQGELIEAPEFGYLMTLPLDFKQVDYYGKGEKENYIDRCQGAFLGRYQYDIDENFTPYLMPQECGNRTGVRWADVKTSNGRGLHFESERCELSCLRYLPNEIENARHQDELPTPYQTVVRINWMQMGVAGDNTWGARTHDEYLLPKGEKLHFTFSFKGF